MELVLSYGTYPDQDKTETKSKIMARVDKNKDGRLDEDEFCELFAEEMRHLAVIRAAREKFKELDGIVFYPVLTSSSDTTNSFQH